jgi:hypothetical protein
VGVEGDGVREGQGAYAPFVVDTCVVRGDSDWDGGDDALVAGSAVALYAHAGLPVLSAFCAATTAAMGAAAGICLVLDVVDTCVVRGDSDWDGGDDALVAGSAVGHCRQRGTAHPTGLVKVPPYSDRSTAAWPQTTCAHA